MISALATRLLVVALVFVQAALGGVRGPVACVSLGSSAACECADMECCPPLDCAAERSPCEADQTHPPIPHPTDTIDPCGDCVHLRCVDAAARDDAGQTAVPAPLAAPAELFDALGVAMPCSAAGPQPLPKPPDGRLRAADGVRVTRLRT
jgi:hypothetical protein